MKKTTENILSELIFRYPCLSTVKSDILHMFEIVKNTYDGGGKLLVCGNGGSAADSEHIVGELMKKFKKERPVSKDMFDALNEYGDDGKILQRSLEGCLSAVSLTSHTALSTAFSNDNDPSVSYAQQLYGLARVGDTLLTLSTSGNSRNCVLAAVTAKAMKVRIVALTGQNESKLSSLADAAVKVPQTETYKIQELHLPVYHCLCAMLENEFFD